MTERKTLKNRPSIFRKTNGTIPELEEEGQEQQAVQMSRRPNDQLPSQPDSTEGRVKATFYLGRDDIVAIDQMQTEAFKRTGKKPERSHIVSEAIQGLLRQQTV